MKTLTKEYETFGHAKTKIRYHIIFSTKYRRKCLNYIKDIVLDSFRQAEMNQKFKIYEMNIDEDHIHFMLMVPPSMSVASAVGKLKQYSTYNLYRNPISLNHLRKFYWYDNILWTSGYFCSTIGEVSAETLKYYIENQG